MSYQKINFNPLGTPRLVVRVSEISDKTHTMIIHMTDSEYAEVVEFLKNRYGARHIQNILPNNSADEREFILTGITAEEWALAFGEEEE